MATDSITIDCDTCIMKDTDACGDCVVTYLCDREPEVAVVIDMADFRAVSYTHLTLPTIYSV